MTPPTSGSTRTPTSSTRRSPSCLPATASGQGSRRTSDRRRGRQLRPIVARRISANVATAIQQLRTLLAAEADPIDRHYMMAELEDRLYQCRDAFSSALDEYDAVCRQHDVEM